MPYPRIRAVMEEWDGQNHNALPRVRRLSCSRRPSRAMYRACTGSGLLSAFAPNLIAQRFRQPADALGADQPTAHASCSMLYLSRISGSGDLVILPSDRQLNRGSLLAIERFC